NVEEIEEIPFVSSSTIIMPHKFQGLSIYDRLKMIQDQKTALWRNILDNLYLQNNREKEVVEGQVNIDDLLISRPGGIKRVKAPGMIRELQVQPIGPEGPLMMEYLDKVRTGRVGVSPDTMGSSLPVGGDTAHGVERMMSAKEELTALMIRTVAETGVKAAYILIRDLLIRHQDSQQQFKFRGTWAQVDPSSWGPRSRMTANVGTGTGDDMRKQGAIQQVIGYQAQLAEMQSPLVDHMQGFNALDTFCETAGLQGAEDYFLDPRSDSGKQAIQEQEQSQQKMQQQQEELQQKMAEAQQQIAQGELMKGQAAMQAQQVKAQSEQVKAQSEQVKLQAEHSLNQMQMQLDAAKTLNDELQNDTDSKIKVMKIRSDEQLAMAKMESEEALKLMQMELDAQQSLGDRLDAQKDRDLQKEISEDSATEDSSEA
ncbi:MAG: portal protein, partial [Alphaproteobacteria bacterium]